METAAAVFAFLFPDSARWWSVREGVDEFSRFLNSQLKLSHEAVNLARFVTNFSDDPNVHFPAPILPFVTSDVILEEYCAAMPLQSLLSQAANPVSHEFEPQHLSLVNRSLARIGMSMFLSMLVDKNFIHSDLHPGNLLVRVRNPNDHRPKKVLKTVLSQPTWWSTISAAIRSTIDRITDSTDPDLPILDREIRRRYHHHRELMKQSESLTDHQLSTKLAAVASRGNLELVVLDAGLVTEMKSTNRKNFLSLFGAMAEGDGRLAARLMLVYSRDSDCQNVAAYEEEMHQVIKQLPNATLGTVEISVLLRRVLEMIRTYRVKIESDFSSLIVAIAVLEGIGRQLDPSLSLVVEAIPFLLLNPEARRLLLQAGGSRLVSALTDRANGKASDCELTGLISSGQSSAR